MISLKECAEVIFSGITPKSGGDAYTENDGVLFIKSGSLSTDGILNVDFSSQIKHDIHNGIMKSSKLKKNDVLIAIVGATIGKVALFDLECDANINQAIAAVRLKDTILPEFLTAYMLSTYGQTYLEYLKRPVARANINLQEIGEIMIPALSIDEQKKFAKTFFAARLQRNSKLNAAKSLVDNAKEDVYTQLNISFSEYNPSLFSYQRYQDIKENGIFCNTHSAYQIELFQQLKTSKWYVGTLDNYVYINPISNRKQLLDSDDVSFVPMPAVSEKTNQVIYEIKKYADVKTGFTIFQRNDLLWAKITPCMQNGKSFIADKMPTEIGFGSTEFHVLRQKNDSIYMPFLWVILSESHVLEAAQGMFSGSAGQQRVPDAFLSKFPMVAPPIEVQKKLANNVIKALELAETLRKDAEREWNIAKQHFEKELLGE